MASYVWSMLGYRQEAEMEIPKPTNNTTNPFTPELRVSELFDVQCEEEEQTTPRATPVAPTPPNFSDEEEDDLPPPSFPAVNSAQRASKQPAQTPGLMLPPSLPNNGSMPPPPRPNGLMPPPSRPSAASSLRVPTTGPLPNRSPNRNGNLTTLSPTAVKTPNPRAKVQLTPGHSPLDWAALQRSNKNLSGVPSLLRVTPSMLKAQNGRKGKAAWSSYQGKVYNISPYLPFHPGGEGELRRAAGRDGGKLFHDVHPWVNWENMLGECIVGVMVSESEAVRRGESELDEMD